MGLACTITSAINWNGQDTLELTPNMTLAMPADIPAGTTLTFDVLVPAGGAGSSGVYLSVSSESTPIPGASAETSGAASATWVTVGPIALAAGQQTLNWTNDFIGGGNWPAGMAPFYLGQVKINDYPIDLKLWCDEDGGSVALAADYSIPLTGELATTPQPSYFTSFEEHGIWYFLRYIPWLDFSSLDLFTAIEQSSTKALSGTYSAKFMQRPPLGASTLWSKVLDVPVVSTGITVSFGTWAERPDAKLIYKMWMDGNLVANKVGGVLMAQAWFRSIITEPIPLGTKTVKFEIALDGLPNIPLDNYLYMDDLVVDFGVKQQLSPRSVAFSDLDGNIFAINNQTGQQIWTSKLASGYVTAPLASAGSVYYFGSNASQGVVSAWGAESGSHLWDSTVQGPVDHTPFIDDNIVYVLAGNGILYGLDSSDGGITYQAPVMTGVTGLTVFGVVIVDGVAYITSSEGVHAFNIALKTVLWTVDTLHAVKNPPTLWRGYCFVGRTDGQFMALRTTTGQEVWPTINVGEPIYTTPQIFGANVIFGTDGGSLIAVNIATGNQVWKISKPGRIRGFKVLGDRVYLVSNGVQGTFYAYSYTIDDNGVWTFTLAWSVPVAGGIQQAPIINDQSIYFTGGDFNLYALNALDGSQRWDFTSPSLSFAAPTIAEAPAITNLSRRYDQCCFICTHNAFANTSSGWIYAEQSGSVTSQLNDGVRAFMLDVATAKCVWQYDYEVPAAGLYCDASVSAPTEIYMIHENLTMTTAAMGGSLNSLRTFTKELEKIKEWMDNNENEVVTIILESQVSSASLMETTLKAAGVWDMIFWADKTNTGLGGTWNVATNKGWPTLQWMVSAGKRLVILSQHRSGNDGLPDVWSYAVENDYGNKGIAPGCNPRRGSQPLNSNPPYLFIMNYFVDWSVSHAIWYPFHYSQQNDYYGIMTKVVECNAAAGRLPNFIAVDFYQRGNNGGPKAAVAATDGRWQAQAQHNWVER